MIRSGAEKYELGVEIVGINLLDIHPPVAIVPNYRDVANALEEREQLLNEAQTTYVRELYSAVGETGVHLLERMGEKEQIPAGGFPSDRLPDWKLDETIWSALIAGQADKPPLAGKSGAMLHAARQSAAELVEAATADADRFLTLLKPYQADPWLTRLDLYWIALERGLSTTVLTIVDPAARGRQQLFLSESPGAELPPPPIVAPPPQTKPEPDSREDQ